MNIVAMFWEAIPPDINLNLCLPIAGILESVYSHNLTAAHALMITLFVLGFWLGRLTSPRPADPMSLAPFSTLLRSIKSKAAQILEDELRKRRSQEKYPHSKREQDDSQNLNEDELIVYHKELLAFLLEEPSEPHNQASDYKNHGLVQKQSDLIGITTILTISRPNATPFPTTCRSQSVSSKLLHCNFPKPLSTDEGRSWSPESIVNGHNQHSCPVYNIAKDDNDDQTFDNEASQVGPHAMLVEKVEMVDMTANPDAAGAGAEERLGAEFGIAEVPAPPASTESIDNYASHEPGVPIPAEAHIGDQSKSIFQEVSKEEEREVVAEQGGVCAHELLRSVVLGAEGDGSAHENTKDRIVDCGAETESFVNGALVGMAADSHSGAHLVNPVENMKLVPACGETIEEQSTIGTISRRTSVEPSMTSCQVQSLLLKNLPDQRIQNTLDVEGGLGLGHQLNAFNAQSTAHNNQPVSSAAMIAQPLSAFVSTRPGMASSQSKSLLLNNLPDQRIQNTLDVEEGLGWGHQLNVCNAQYSPDNNQFLPISAVNHQPLSARPTPVQRRPPVATPSFSYLRSAPPGAVSAINVAANPPTSVTPSQYAPRPRPSARPVLTNVITDPFAFCKK